MNKKVLVAALFVASLSLFIAANREQSMSAGLCTPIYGRTLWPWCHGHAVAPVVQWNGTKRSLDYML